MIDVRDRLKQAEEIGPARLISIFPLDNADGTLDIIYMFQVGADVMQHRYTIEEDEELSSLSDLFKGALNMEREMVDLFGIKVKGVEGGLLLCPESGVVKPLRKPPMPKTEAKEEEDA
jgi:NADH:ubiquinone oxidoreductase subunit C